jgi:hypothetical protein
MLERKVRMKKSNLIKISVVTWLICVCTLYPFISQAGTIIDDFDGASINNQLWSIYHTDEHQRGVQQGGVLKIQIDGVSEGIGFGAVLSSRFSLKGNFEIVVDYNLTNWPYANGVEASISFSVKDNFWTANGKMSRQSLAADESFTPKEIYHTVFWDGALVSGGIGFIPTTDSSGRMKLTRVGQVITGYFFNQLNNGWQICGSCDYSAIGPDDWIIIGLGAHSKTSILTPEGQLIHPFAGLDVEIAFDNLQITYDQIRYSGYVPLFLLLD